MDQIAGKHDRNINVKKKSATMQLPNLITYIKHLFFCFTHSILSIYSAYSTLICLNRTDIVIYY